MSFLDIIKDILNPLQSFFKPLGDFITKGGYEISNGMFSWFESELTKSADIINNGGANNAVLTSTASLVSDAVKPTAWTLLTIFFLIELYDQWQRKQDNFDFIDLLKGLIKLLVCKNLITIMPFLMQCIRGTVTPIYANLVNANGGALAFDNISETLASNFTSIISILPALLLAGVLWIVGLYIHVIAYVRDFELAILEALSCLPVIFYVYQDTKDIPKRFIFSYASVVMQGLVIMIVFVMYQAMLQDALSSGIINVIFASAVAFMGIKKSADWAGKALGQ